MNLIRLSVCLLLVMMIAPVSSQQAECPAPVGTDALAYGINLFACGDTEAALGQFNDLLNTTTDPVARAQIQMYAGRAYLATNTADAALNAQINFERAFLAFNNAQMTQESGIAYYYAGLAKRARNLTNEALTYFYTGLTRAQTAEDRRTQGLITRAIAEITYEQQNYNQALDEFNQSYEHLIAAEDYAEQINSGHKMADLLFQLGRLPEARTVYEQTLDLARRESLHESTAYSLYRLAYWDNESALFDTALAKLEEALELYRMTDSTTDIIATHLMLGWTYALNGDYSLAAGLLPRESTHARRIGNCPLEMEAQTYLGWAQRLRGDFAQALDTFETALSLPCAESQPRLRSLALNGQGETFHEMGNYTAGNDSLQFALTASRQLGGDKVTERGVMLSLGKYTWRAGQTLFGLRIGRTFRVPSRGIEEAETYLYAAQTLAEAQGSPITLIVIDQNFAAIRAHDGDYSEALTLLEAALTRTNAIGYTLVEAEIIEQIGSLYFQRSDFQSALAFFEQAQAIYGAERSAPFEARMFYYRGIIYETEGQFDLADTFFARAVTAFTALNDQQNQALALLSRGDLAAQFGRTTNAKTFYNRAILISPGRVEALALLRRGEVDLREWDEIAASSVNIDRAMQNQIYDQVEADYRRALALLEAIQDRSGQVEALNRLGRLTMRRRIPANFGPGGFFQRALLLSREIENVPLEMEALYNLAVFYHGIPDYDQALIYYDDAYVLASEYDVILATTIRIEVASIYETQGLRRQAIDEYRNVLPNIEGLYSRITNEGDRLRFGEQAIYLQPYERLIRFYGLNRIERTLQEDAAAVLNFAERSRARSFLFQLGQQTIQFTNEDEAAVFTAWTAVRDRLVTLTRQRDNARIANNQEQINILDGAIRIAESELNSLETALPRGALRQFTGIAPASLQEIQAALPDDTAMIAYYLSRETSSATRTEAGRIFIIVITPDDIVLHPTLFNSYQVDLLDRINAFRRSLVSSSPIQPLYALLIQPIEAQIEGYENLVIIPHDVLNYLPFEALADASGTALIERFSVNYAPSATVYSLLAQQEIASAETAVNLVMNFGDDLFYAEDEAITVGELTGSEVFSFEDATETRLRDQAGAADLIHIAAHGIFDPANPLESYIALGEDASNDGRLTVQEVYSLPLREQNPLVVLSACETAVSMINPGDELQGLSRAFLLTGARGVVASLWAVDDAATAELMSTFYRARANGMSDADALTEAKRAVRALHPEPRYWAGFILMGSGT